MSNEEIIENNLLLAEFMGWKVVTGLELGLPYKTYFYGLDPQTKQTRVGLNNRDITSVWQQISNNAKYHKSWNDLMPVVEKISKDERVDCVSLVISSGCDVHFKEVFNGADCWVPMGSNDSPIGAAYKMCIKFIKWYNKQKT